MFKLNSPRKALNKISQKYRNVFFVFLIALAMSMLIFSPAITLNTSAYNLTSTGQPSTTGLSALALTPCSNINFSSASTFSTSLIPQSIVIGDIDGDGLPDLATTGQFVPAVSILRNTSTSGNTSFAARVDLPLRFNSITIAIGDLDGDGLPDLAVSNSIVSIFRNTSTSGNISFATRVDLPNLSASVAIGDLDGDGKLDLVSGSGSTVSILRNTSTSGTISFANQQTLSTGSSPRSIAIGDIDGDSLPDLATANFNDNTVSVFRNTSTSGTISFANQQTLSTGSSPRSIAIGDLDGDGKLDLATANRFDDTVSVFRNTSTSGTISFANQQTLSTNSLPNAVAIGDLDGDGKLDLVTGNTMGTASVLRNTSTSGNISFATKVDFATSLNPLSVAIGDLNGDGKLDLATANSNNNTVSVLANTCTPSQTTTTTSVSSSANPSVFGQSTTFTATVSPTASGTPTGTVTFNIDGTNQSPVNLVNGQATFSTSSLSVASHSVTATYSGDTSFLTSTSTPLTQVVNKANTSTSVGSSANPSVFGQSTTFTATVSINSPGSGTLTGTVQFKDGANNLGSAVSLVNGQAQLITNSLSVTSHSITAVYSGDTNFNTSTSAALTQVVNKANTSTSLSANPNQIVFGQMVTFTSTVSASSPGSGTPTGTVTFKDGTTTLGSPSLVNGQATLTVAITNVATRTITATYSGDTNFNPSTSTNVSLFVSTLDHNTIYVADTLNNRIQRSTDQGTTWKTIGNGAGVGAGQFNAPRSVASNFADTVIFVADTANNRIQRSTDGGSTWQVIATGGTATNQVNQPSGVAYDEINNKLYIADTTNSRILVVTNPTSTSPIFAVFAGASAGTAVGKVNQPQSVAIDLSGKVYVADTANNRIQVNSNGLSTSWTVLAAPGTATGQVNTPKSVYVDNSGRIWVADNANNRVQVNINSVWSVFMSVGTTVGTVNRPEGVVVNLSGNVFIADTGNNRIQSKPASGGTAAVVGAPGLSIGQFNQPSGIR